jgi:DNA-directed RNA polymerase specialized sigma24 family protein
MSDDSELLRRYVEGNEENAFRELVTRHLDFVFSAAMRQVNGDAHSAADVTQRVFTDFARRARSLIGRPSLMGWLFVSTRYTAAKVVRTERRRQAREQEAVIMNESIESSTALLDWNLIRPVLDEALAKWANRIARQSRVYDLNGTQLRAVLRDTDNNFRLAKLTLPQEGERWKVMVPEKAVERYARMLKAATAEKQQ